eukprot:gene6204-7726_t
MDINNNNTTSFITSSKLSESITKIKVYPNNTKVTSSKAIIKSINDPNQRREPIITLFTKDQSSFDLSEFDKVIFELKDPIVGITPRTTATPATTTQLILPPDVTDKDYQPPFSTIKKITGKCVETKNHEGYTVLEETTNALITIPKSNILRSYPINFNPDVFSNNLKIEIFGNGKREVKIKSLHPSNSATFSRTLNCNLNSVRDIEKVEEVSLEFKTYVQWKPIFDINHPVKATFVYDKKLSVVIPDFTCKNFTNSYFVTSSIKCKATTAIFLSKITEISHGLYFENDSNNPIPSGPVQVHDPMADSWAKNIVLVNSPQAGGRCILKVGSPVPENIYLDYYRLSTQTPVKVKSLKLSRSITLIDVTKSYEMRFTFFNHFNTQKDLLIHNSFDTNSEIITSLNEIEKNTFYQKKVYADEIISFSLIFTSKQSFYTNSFVPPEIINFLIQQEVLSEKILESTSFYNVDATRLSPDANSILISLLTTKIRMFPIGEVSITDFGNNGNKPSLFGATTTQPGGFGFKGNSTGFGQTNTNYPTNNNFVAPTSLFGATTTSVPAAGLFGTQAPSSFGGSATSTSSLFGASTTPASTPAPSSFGGSATSTSSPFNAPTTSTSSPCNVPTTSSTFSFGATTTSAPAAGLFGTPTPSSFGGSATSTSSPFGASTTSASTPAPSSFGGSATSTSSPFNAHTTSPGDPWVSSGFGSGTVTTSTTSPTSTVYSATSSMPFSFSLPPASSPAAPTTSSFGATSTQTFSLTQPQQENLSQEEQQQNRNFPNLTDLVILKDSFTPNLCLAKNLTTLRFGSGYNTVTSLVIGSIPPSVLNLTIGIDIADPISPGIIPDTVVNLTLYFYLFSNKEPTVLKSGIIPSSVKRLTLEGLSCSNLFDRDFIPPSLLHLKCKSDISLPFGTGMKQNQNQQQIRSFKLPPYLKSFSFVNTVPQIVVHGDLPNSITKLTIGKGGAALFQKNSIPPTVKRLKFFNGKQSFLNELLSKILNDGVGSAPNQLVNIIPPSVTELVYEDRFYKALVPGIIPNDVVNLEFGVFFDQDIPNGSIPSSVKWITFGQNFNKPLVKCQLPDSLEFLNLGGYWNHPLDGDILPKSLIYLVLSMFFNHPIDIGVLPDTLRYLSFGQLYNCPIQIGAIPPDVLSISFGDTFNQELKVGMIPSRVKFIKFGALFNHPSINEPGVVPIDSLRRLSIYNESLLERIGPTFTNNIKIEFFGNRNRIVQVNSICNSDSFTYKNIIAFNKKVNDNQICDKDWENGSFTKSPIKATFVLNDTSNPLKLVLKEFTCKKHTDSLFVSSMINTEATTSVIYKTSTNEIHHGFYFLNNSKNPIPAGPVSLSNNNETPFHIYSNSTNNGHCILEFSKPIPVNIFFKLDRIGNSNVKIKSMKLSKSISTLETLKSTEKYYTFFNNFGQKKDFIFNFNDKTSNIKIETSTLLPIIKDKYYYKSVYSDEILPFNITITHQQSFYTNSFVPQEIINFLIQHEVLSEKILESTSFYNVDATRLSPDANSILISLLTTKIRMFPFGDVSGIESTNKFIFGAGQQITTNFGYNNNPLLQGGFGLQNTNFNAIPTTATIVTPTTTTIVTPTLPLIDPKNSISTTTSSPKFEPTKIEGGVNLMSITAMLDYNTKSFEEHRNNDRKYF